MTPRWPSRGAALTGGVRRVCPAASAGWQRQGSVSRLDVLQQTGEAKAVPEVGLQLPSPLEGAVNQGRSPRRPPDCLDFWEFVAVNAQLRYSM